MEKVDWWVVLKRATYDQCCSEWQSRPYEFDPVDRGLTRTISGTVRLLKLSHYLPEGLVG
jgi:hypothetical protein